MKKLFPKIIFLLCFICCKSTKNPVEIKFQESDQEVTLFYSKKMKTVSVISLPFDVEVKNLTFTEKGFRNYTYVYGNRLKGNPIKLYLVENDDLIEQSFSKIKSISAKKTNKYLVRSKHFVDTTKFNKDFFKPYIEKMMSLKQDTLGVGTISQFKSKHKNLLNHLIQNDSISFLFLTKKGFEQKVLPVEY